MTNKDKKAFAVLMAAMHEVFTPDRDLPNERQKARAQIYFSTLKDLPIQAIEKAAEQVIKTRKAKYPPFPTPAEIREMVFGDKDDIEAEAIQAWEQAYHLDRKMYEMERGYIEKKNLTEEELVIVKTINLAFGGWGNYQSRMIHNEGFDRIHFIKCYKISKHNIIRKQLMLGTGEKTKGILEE